MLLRNRSRAVTKSLMTDHSSSPQSSPNQRNYTKPIPPFFGSPRFKAFTFNKGLPEPDPMMSPTSILDTTRPFPLKNPFWFEPNNQPNSPKIDKKHSWDKLDSKGIVVALIDNTPSNEPIEEKESSGGGSSNRRMVLFGTKLRVQIPPLPNSTLSPSESPKSPADFGIKTRSPQLSASGSTQFGFQTKDCTKVFTGCLSISEMELSEDYTCVISHGPNPKTTHIFDNCIVENCSSWSSSGDTKSNIISSPKNFLSCCYTCKKNLEQKNDIYIYRGEKAFCSRECRYQEMLLDDEEEN